MRAARWTNISSGAVCVVLFVVGLANLFSQSTQTSPTPGASPQPSASPSRTPQPRPTPSPFPGAQNFHKWGSITVFNGLPSDSVRAIAQTPDGLMWFGTDNGLARFDGRRIQNFSLAESDKNGVLALKASPSGELWIGTEAGAFVYSGGQFRPINGTTQNAVTSILLDADNYLGSNAGLLYRVTANEQGDLIAENLFPEPIVTADGAPAAVTSLAWSNQKLLAATAGGGVLVIDGDRVSEFKNQPKVENNAVNGIVNGGGALWLGTDAKKGESGVYRAESDVKPTRIAAPTARANVLCANGNDIWAGSDRYGLFQFSGGGKLAKTYTFENTAGGLRSDTIFALFFDREGVLWIGTNRGVSRYDTEAPNQQTVSDIPNSNFIRTLYRSADGRSLLAGSNRGLFTFDGKDWKPVAGFDNKVVYSITTVNGITVGTATGAVDGSGKSIADGDTRAIQTFQGTTYAAVYGVGVTTLGTNRIIFNDNAVTSLLASDRLWIGTSEHGLFSYDGKTVKSEIAHETLKSGTIWKMFETPDRALWIAEQHGVFRVTYGQAQQVIAAEEVRDVYVDGADVWAASTTRGLVHARNNDRFGWVVSSVGFEQGLPSDKAFAIMPPTSREGLMIATNRGVVTYMPHDIAPKLIATRVLSQRMHDVGEIASTIALDYPQNSMLVEVAGLSSRTFPEEFQYAFVLTDAKGKEVDRKLSNDSQYSPTNLKPGEYQIESIAFNRDLVASEPLFIRFSVAKAPFPWTATALGVLLLLAVAGLVWAVVEHRRMRQKNRDLAAARLDLANEAERERRRIARDLHDQTLADLRNLMMMSDKLTPGQPEFRSEIENVSGEIRRICEDLSPSVLENVGLVASLHFVLEHTIDSSRFNAPDDLEEKIKLPLNVQLQIYRIAQEVLNNIKSHSDATEVEMTTGVDDAGKFHLSIADNGHTFSPDGSTPKGRGIANIKARASLINGRIQWRERRKGGNSFSLTV